MTLACTVVAPSDRLCAPSDSPSLRRLSDSIICRAQDNLAKQSESELCQLRKWASEAMSARPDYYMHEQALIDKESSQTAWTHRAVSERCPSPEAQSTSTRRSFFHTNGWQARPTSMLATMPSVDYSPPSTSSPSLERSRSVRRKSERRERSSVQEANGSAQETPKSQAALKLLPDLGASKDACVLTSPTRGKSSKSHGLHLSLLPSHALLSPDERTPRGKSVVSLASPSWTSSTSESDDDKYDLMTPSDGQSPCQRKEAVVPMSHHVLSDAVGSNDGPKRELDSVGSSAEQTMQSMTGITLAGRRGSLPPSATKSRVSFALPSVCDEDAIFKSAPLANSPVIKRATLFEVGSVDGITPPALREHPTYSTDSPSSQVVSAGLEMGLGVTMAVSALSCNLPTTSSTSISNLAEPRFSHNAVPLSAHTTSDQAMSFARRDREEAELARRRTTGGLAGSKKEAGTVGIRRHARAGTHDPGSSTSSALATSGHRLTSSVSGPTTTPEEAIRRPDGLRLDTSDSIRRGHLSSSDTRSTSSATLSSGIDSTPTDTLFGSHKATVSPDASVEMNRRSYISSGEDANAAGRRAFVSNKEANVDAASPPQPAGKIIGGLLGMGGGGHFGPGVRAKIAQVLADLIEQVPTCAYDAETVQLVEYGCLNSRSSQLMQPIISAFVDKQARDPLQQERQLSFQVTHEDSSSADFRPLTQLLDHHSESYLDPQWQDSHSPSLANTIFSSFAARPFASRIAPPNTFHAGISLMDLHWIHTPISATVSPALTAQAELTTFLSARGSEFRKGGLFIMAYIARSEDPCQHKDIWTTLSNTLAPCIQRLVSCSMVKSEVARHLLNLPMHPRSAKQTLSVLQSVESVWNVEWSCGLESQEACSSGLRSEPLPLRLPHPAWKAYDSGTLSRIPFTEHMVQLFKNLYESHFRNVLREKGKLTKGAVEFVLDSLWDVLFSRIVDQDPSPMKDIEVEVSIVALRRK